MGGIGGLLSSYPSPPSPRVTAWWLPGQPSMPATYSCLAFRETKSVKFSLPDSFVSFLGIGGLFPPGSCYQVFSLGTGCSDQPLPSLWLLTGKSYSAWYLWGFILLDQQTSDCKISHRSDPIKIEYLTRDCIENKVPRNLAHLHHQFVILDRKGNRTALLHFPRNQGSGELGLYLFL